MIFNIKTEEMYIGQSTNIDRRIEEHIQLAGQYTGHPYRKIYEAMNKYNLEDFEFIVLEECPVEELNGLEQYYIKVYNSFECGYNMTPGGEGYSIGESNPGAILNNDKVMRIKELLGKSYLSIAYLAREFNISRTNIHMINTGVTWSHIGEYKYPIRKVNLPKLNECSRCGKRIRPDSTLCRGCHHKSIQGEGHPQTELTNQQVMKIKDLLKDSDISLINIARDYGITKDVVSSINLGYTWNMLGDFHYPIRDNRHEPNYCPKCGERMKPESNVCVSCYRKDMIGDRNQKSKLTDVQVLEIKNQIKNTNLTLKAIALDNGVSTTTVKGINSGRSRGNVGEFNYPIRDNRVQVNYCKNCGNKINPPADLCSSCYGKSRRKYERPSREELERAIRENKNILIVSRMYGVSRGAVVHWLQAYGLPSKDLDIWNMFK